MDWDCNSLAAEYTSLNGPEQAALWQDLAQGETADWLEERADGVRLQAGRLLLDFRTGENPGLGTLADRRQPRIWADAGYLWQISLSGENDPENTLTARRPVDVTLDIHDQKAAGWQIVYSGSLLDCQVEIRYHVPAGGWWLDEEITIKNNGCQAVRLVDWNFGPARKLGFSWTHSIGPDLQTLRAFAIPWYRTVAGHPEAIQDYDLDKLRYSRGAAGMAGPSANGHPAEAWGLVQDQCGLLVIKYAPEQIEYSVLRSESREETPQLQAPIWVAKERRTEHLVFGGSTRCHDDPSPDLLQPGARIELGLTRYQLFDGSLDQGFSLFRAFMEGRGCGVRTDYDPLVHWNELYDNTFDFFEQDAAKYQEDQRLHYSLENMLLEAAKARKYHCDTLYLDPGWDTAFASSIWNEPRLGSLADFTRRLKQDFNLQLALHTPLAGWCNPAAYPETAQLSDARGVRHPGHLCSGAQEYLAAKAARLRALAKSGVSFLMFDGTFYTGPCCDPAHGHALPYTRDAHMQNCRWLARQVHAVDPAIAIEMHDFVVSGVADPYCPVYLGYGQSGFDEAWGYEMMWNPMKDLESGAALALYYYNLAYSIPLYLHIDLKKENSQCLMFWWFASTCRHLGIGGTHDDPLVEQKLIKAMLLYQRLKPYYARGEFTGLAEHAHLHTLADVSGGVLNLFNLGSEDRLISCAVPATVLKMPAGCSLADRGDSQAGGEGSLAFGESSLEWRGTELHISCEIPAKGAKVIVI